MEVVNTLDIDGTQWNIQDSEARNEIAVIKDLLTTKVLENPTITKSPETNWTYFTIKNHYSFGKIHFIYIRLQNVSNASIGTTASVNVCKFNIMPIRDTSFIMFDYVNGRTTRCYFETDGQFVIGESNGVVSGNNVCFGELIFAEA